MAALERVAGLLMVDLSPSRAARAMVERSAGTPVNIMAAAVRAWAAAFSTTAAPSRFTTALSQQISSRVVAKEMAAMEQTQLLRTDAMKVPPFSPTTAR